MVICGSSMEICYGDRLRAQVEGCQYQHQQKIDFIKKSKIGSYKFSTPK
jgi:hypothetical protein